MLNSRQNRQLFGLCDLEIWQMTSKNKRAALLYHFKLCASFCSHLWIQTGVTVWKRSIRVQIVNILARVTYEFDRWSKKQQGTSSMMLQIGEKNVLTSVTLTFNLWTWRFARTSLLSMVIAHGNFMMIWWQEHCEKGVTDGQTGKRRTEPFLELLGHS